MEKIQLDPEWVRWVNRGIHKIDSADGPNVANTPTSLTIGDPAKRQRRPSSPTTELPTPQYESQYYKGLANNVGGFGYPTASPPPP